MSKDFSGVPSSWWPPSLQRTAETRLAALTRWRTARQLSFGKCHRVSACLSIIFSKMSNIDHQMAIALRHIASITAPP